MHECFGASSVTNTMPPGMLKPLSNELEWCQKPFNLEGVDFNVDSLNVINLRSVKSELLLENIK